MRFRGESGVAAVCLERAGSLKHVFTNALKFRGSTYFKSAGFYLGLKLAAFSLTSLLSQFCLTRYLSRGDYGLLIWASTIIALMSPFGLPGISNSIAGAVAKGYEGNFRVATKLELLGGGLGGVVLAAMALYYGHWMADPGKGWILATAALLSPGLWLDTHLCYWNGKKNFKALFWWPVSVRLAQFAATIAVVLTTRNPIWVFATQNILFAAANIATPIGMMFSRSVNGKVLKDYMSYGWFSTKLYWLGNLSVYWDKLVVSHLFGLESLAMFAVGEMIYTYFFKTPASFLAQIFLPRLAELDLPDAARWVRNKQPLLIAAVLITCILLAVAIPIAYPILFSHKYNGSISYAYLYLICIATGAPTLLSGTILKAHALEKETRNGWLVSFFGPVILMPALGYAFGINGIIYAKAATNGLLSAYYLFLLIRLQSGKSSRKPMGRADGEPIPGEAGDAHG